MEFIVRKGSKYGFSPVYDMKEQAFFTEPNAPGDFSVMIKGGYTSLDVSLISSTVYCVSGCNPQKTWKKAKLTYPSASDGTLAVNFDFDAQRGTGVDYAVDWQTFYDKSTGVICIRGSEIPHDAENVEFTDKTVASVYDGKLAAVWIKPRFVK